MAKAACTIRVLKKYLELYTAYILFGTNLPVVNLNSYDLYSGRLNYVIYWQK